MKLNITVDKDQLVMLMCLCRAELSKPGITVDRKVLVQNTLLAIQEPLVQKTLEEYAK